jgi:hypothetical protein
VPHQENRFAFVVVAALSREPKCGRRLADAVELCPRGAHGGFHGKSIDETNGMTEAKDEGSAPRAGGEIRKETAEGAPEVAEHDHVAALERQLEEAKSTRFTPRPRRRTYGVAWKRNSSRQQAMRRRASRASWRSRIISTARLQSSARSFAPMKTAAQFLAGIEIDLARARCCVPRHGSRASVGRASRSTRIVTRR